MGPLRTRRPLWRRLLLEINGALVVQTDPWIMALIERNAKYRASRSTRCRFDVGLAGRLRHGGVRKRPIHWGSDTSRCKICEFINGTDHRLLRWMWSGVFEPLDKQRGTDPTFHCNFTLRVLW